MSLDRRMLRRAMLPLLVVVVGISLLAPSAAATERRVKVKVQAVYPELARRMSVSGVVKLELTVAPSGVVKSWKVLGGHPLLVDAAVDAAKKWKYEPGPEETTESVEFAFKGSE